MNRKVLIEAAILGLERHPLPSEAAAESLPGDDDASALLRALAKMHFSGKVARPLQDAPPLPPSDSGSSRDVISPRSARHLNAILSGLHNPAWDEFFDGIQKAGKTVPPEALPALLQRAAKAPQSAEKILALCGSRGAWLAAQVPQWQKLYAKPGPDAWSHASPEERIPILRYLRASRPGEGLKLLLSTWEEDGQRERQVLLKELQTGLSLADEPFLERCLDDKRQEVRRIAAGLLALLPDSALSGRLFRFSAGLWSQKDIRPPDSQPTALLRDGIEPLPAGKAGAKAELIRRLFSRIAPLKWEDFFSETPVSVIRRLEKSEWAVPLVSGLCEAIVFHQTANWADAMLLRLSEKSEQPDADAAASMAQCISPGGLEQLVIIQLRENRGLIPNNSVSLIALNNAPYAWPERMALQLIDGFRKWLWQINSQDWSMEHYRQLLRLAAYRCPVHLYGPMEKDWPMQSRAWGFWEKDVQFFLRGMAFRKEMLEALA